MGLITDHRVAPAVTSLAGPAGLVWAIVLSGQDSYQLLRSGPPLAAAVQNTRCDNMLLPSSPKADDLVSTLASCRSLIIQGSLQASPTGSVEPNTSFVLQVICSSLAAAGSNRRRMH